MSRTIKTKRGFDIHFTGTAKDQIKEYHPSHYAVKPIDFIGMSPIPKLIPEIGSEVKAGDPLFFDKKQPEIIYCAPVSGEFAGINRGPKRRIDEIVIVTDKNVSFKSFDVPALTAKREDLVSFLLASGVWPFIVQRPYGVRANHNDVPRDIFVSLFDSSPLAPSTDVLTKGNEDAIQKGIDVLSELTEGKVYVGIDPKSSFKQLKNCVITTFDGPHPAGNVGVQIHHIAPINKGEIVWTMDIQGLIVLGRLFNTGQFDTKRKVALVGNQWKAPMYIETYLGANVEQLINDELSGDNARIVSGSLLTGTTIAKNSFIGWFDAMLSSIEEGNQYEPFGWLMQTYPRPTLSKTFVNGWFGKNKKFDANTNTHGEHRAFVMTGEYEKVLPMKIYPQQLMKAILAGDFDLMEGLGIYELLEEDIALCEFACTSKQDLQQILRQGLDELMEQG